jgi:hypothetical protein
MAAFTATNAAPSPVDAQRSQIEAREPQIGLRCNQLGAYTCLGGDVRICANSGFWTLVAVCGSGCRVINGSPYCV